MWGAVEERGTREEERGTGYSLTVKRKGHLEKVVAGVCKTGSRSEMKGYTTKKKKSHPIRP